MEEHQHRFYTTFGVFLGRNVRDRMATNMANRRSASPAVSTLGLGTVYDAR